MSTHWWFCDGSGVFMNEVHSSDVSFPNESALFSQLLGEGWEGFFVDVDNWDIPFIRISGNESS